MLVPLLLIGAVLYTGYRFRHELQFWKYSGNKLEKRIDGARAVKDRDRRLQDLEQIAEDIDRYKRSNPTDAESFLLSGKAHYLVGENRMGASFSDLVINDRISDIPPLAAKDFFVSMKDFKKAVSLSRNGKIDMEYSLMLAKACFYTHYIAPGEIKKLITDAGNADEIEDFDDYRFFAMILALNKEEDRSIRMMTERNGAATGMQGKLFLASMEKFAKRYTAALMHYSEVLKETADARIKKLVHSHMGEIYFNQSLYQESLSHFESAGAIDGSDPAVKIWMGKNYSALGDKEKAKSLWSAVLTADKENSEAKKLLGMP